MDYIAKDSKAVLEEGKRIGTFIRALNDAFIIPEKKFLKDAVRVLLLRQGNSRVSCRYV